MLIVPWQILCYTARNRRLLNDTKRAIIPIHTPNTVEERIAKIQGIALQIHSAQSIIIINDNNDVPKAQNISTLVAFAIDSQYS